MNLTDEHNSVTNLPSKRGLALILINNDRSSQPWGTAVFEYPDGYQ